MQQSRNRRLHPALVLGLICVLLAPMVFDQAARSQVHAAAGLNLSAANRRAPIAGLPDWSKAGYRGGATLPGSAAIGNTIYAVNFGVKANDGLDDGVALQQAIDSVRGRAGASLDNLTLLVLPAGTINLARQIAVDVSYLIIRGQGNDPASTSATKIVLRPDAATRYDQLTSDGSQPDFGAMISGSGKGGWIWPGRGTFRVQVRDVHPDYQADYDSAPANRKDLFEGTVNVHWKAGLKVRQSVAFAARQGSTTIPIDSSITAAQMTGLQVGELLWIGAANSQKMYQEQGVTNAAEWENGHMKAQVFTIAAVDTANKIVTIDRPLEFDLPANNTSDGSAAISGTLYYSKVMPIKAVRGVGFENFYLTLDITGLPKLDGSSYNLSPANAAHNYGNLAPEYAMHGIVFKGAADSWARNIRTFMTGSHPIVTEVAKNLQFENNELDGAWNKGKGGNGYFRGSRVWDSLFYNNTMRNLRHFTFQWSAANNVVISNSFDSDLNLHGGWERRNLFELNTVQVPYEHAPGSCTTNCGGEGGSTDGGTWYPIWWGAGAKAGKWSGATGPQNVLFNNLLKKQTTAGGSYQDYSPYYSSSGSTARTIFQLGWDRLTVNGSGYQHLTNADGTLLQDWAGSETVNFAVDPRKGVNASRTDAGSSLFLISTGGATPSPSPSSAPSTPTPTKTATPVPTSTPIPTPTKTSIPGPTSTPIPTPTKTATPVPTSTPIPTPPPTGGLKVQYRAGDTNASDNQIQPQLQLVNTGSSSVPLSEIKIRYWYTVDGDKPQSYYCDYATIGCANVTGRFVKLATPKASADYYLEVGFIGGTLAPGASTDKIKNRFAKSDWTNYNETSDYSFDPTKTVFADWTKVTAYRNGALVWGTEP